MPPLRLCVRLELELANGAILVLLLFTMVDTLVKHMVRAVRSNMNNCSSVHAAIMLSSSKIEHGRLYICDSEIPSFYFAYFNWSCHQILWQRLVDIAISELMAVAIPGSWPHKVWIMSCLAEKIRYSFSLPFRIHVLCVYLGVLNS